MDWQKLGKRNVLMVEDDGFNRLLIVSLFSKNEHMNIIEAENGIEALEKLATNKVDVILMDIHMPQMNGFEALEKIQNNSEISHIPIMVLSSDEVEKKKSLNLGAKEFVPKPFNLKALEVQIYNLLKG